MSSTSFNQASRKLCSCEIRRDKVYSDLDLRRIFSSKVRLPASTTEPLSAITASVVITSKAASAIRSPSNRNLWSESESRVALLSISLHFPFPLSLSVSAAAAVQQFVRRRRRLRSTTAISSATKYRTRPNLLFFLRRIP